MPVVNYSSGFLISTLPVIATRWMPGYFSKAHSRVYYSLAISMLTLTGILSCNTAATDKPDQVEAITFSDDSESSERIKTMVAAMTTLPLKTASNGVIIAARQAEIKTRNSGQLIEFKFGIGQAVTRGSLIARLDDQGLQLLLQQRRLDLEEAAYKKADLLILRGGRPDDDWSVSPEVLENVLSESGWKRAAQAFKQIEYEISLARIHAPFDGVLADVKAKLYQSYNAGEVLCRLIDPNSYEAEFALLEGEAANIVAGQPVEVTPLALPGLKLRAGISSVNPVVSKQGLVTVRAKLTGGGSHRLFEGMNVSISIERLIKNQLVIPKSAVVLRSAKPVVFTYDSKEGVAKWNYVTVAYENDTHVAISNGLKVGDTVIFEGNLNLDHDAQVRIDKQTGSK